MITGGIERAHLGKVYETLAILSALMLGVSIAYYTADEVRTNAKLNADNVSNINYCASDWRPPIRPHLLRRQLNLVDGNHKQHLLLSRARLREYGMLRTHLCTSENSAHLSDARLQF